jgi:hypothetical protein
MMDGLAFLPIPDLTNGIHPLRTLCPDDPPEAAEFLDYFDSTYISGRLRQQNPAHNQAVRLVLTRSPPMFPPAIWNVHDATGQVVETALVVDVATKYSCNCTKNYIFKVWTLKCRLLAWQFEQ